MHMNVPYQAFRETPEISFSSSRYFQQQKQAFQY